MRIMMIIVAVLFLREPGLAQQPDQFTQLENPVSKRELLQLPRRDSSPRINLQRALKIAEGFIRKQKIDISSCYLFEAKLVSEEIQEESSWRFWWVSVRGSNAPAKDVRITVTMDGKAQLKNGATAFVGCAKVAGNLRGL